jgi:hypothetical protein
MSEIIGSGVVATYFSGPIVPFSEAMAGYIRVMRIARHMYAIEVSLTWGEIEYICYFI